MLPKVTWSNTFFSETAFLLGNNSTQMFFSPPKFVYTYPMKTNMEARDSLRNVSNTYEITQLLSAYQAKEELDG